MATIAITEKHIREMGPERDFAGETPVAQRYGILSSPRSGSTLLGRFLHETKLAGDPEKQSGELNERLRHEVQAYLGLPPVA